MDLQVGQAVRYDYGNPRYMHYGVIVDVDEKSVGIVDVDYKDDLVRCYDEVGANYERDRNNVQLKHCPPPFTKVSRGVPGRVYAMADMENPVILQKSHLPAYSLQILERGTKVPNADMKKIFEHPWEDQLQKQKTMRRRSGIDISSIIDNEQKEDGMEFY
mgnify:CR=1 FL=1